jgi:formylglycine-generating enzyme required for sulfatase activity
LGSASGQLQLSLQLTPTPVLALTGPTNVPAQIQWSPAANAANTSWFHLAHRFPGSGSVTDTNSPGERTRFYRAVQVPNTNMVLISGGSFVMGDTFNDGPSSERPTHSASVAGFYLDQCELKIDDWESIRQWALTNGYNFDNPGAAKSVGHPVHSVGWHDTLKWCNARSEREGRIPAYYTTPAQTTVFRTGRLDLSNDCVNWAVNGYRLPTEAEWERATRAATNGLRFPLGNTLSHSDANYFAATYLAYDTTGVNDFHPSYATGSPPFTSPCGSFAANRFGLFDLTGNLAEWCWDGYAENAYDQPDATAPNPRGPAFALTNRVVRGGSWFNDASFARNAGRSSAPQTTANDTTGFRIAMTAPTTSGQPVYPARLTESQRIVGGGIRFTVSNLTPGKSLMVEDSTNLTQWQPIWTNVPAVAAVNFTNAPAATLAPRYFRARQQP